MAKKEKDKEQDSLSLIDKLEADIKKTCDGISVFSSVDDVLNRAQLIIPWCPSLDKIIGGGIRVGSWVSLSGKPKTAKTTSALTLAASAQSLGYTVVYANVEARLKDMNLRGIKGLDLSSNKFRVLESKKGKILNSIDYLSNIELCLKTIPNCFIIIDSVSALTHPKMFTDGLDTQLRGANNQFISNFCNICASLVTVNDAILFGIVHMIANTGAMPGGPTTVEKSSIRFVYQSDYRFRIMSCSPWESGDKHVGLIPTIKCDAVGSSKGYPGLSTEVYVRYGVGIDKFFELMNYAVGLGLIRTSGSWNYLDFLDIPDPPKVQGIDNLYKAICENKEWSDKLIIKLKELQ